jgi:hypothetical protein
MHKLTIYQVTKDAGIASNVPGEYRVDGQEIVFSFGAQYSFSFSSVVEKKVVRTVPTFTHSKTGRTLTALEFGQQIQQPAYAKHTSVHSDDGDFEWLTREDRLQYEATIAEWNRVDNSVTTWEPVELVRAGFLPITDEPYLTPIPNTALDADFLYSYSPTKHIRDGLTEWAEKNGYGTMHKAKFQTDAAVYAAPEDVVVVFREGSSEFDEIMIYGKLHYLKSICPDISAYMQSSNTSNRPLSLQNAIASRNAVAVALKKTCKYLDNLVTPLQVETRADIIAAIDKFVTDFHANSLLVKKLNGLKKAVLKA